MDTITLYYGFKESLLSASSESPFLTSTKVSKIEDVRKISKCISLSQYTNPEKKTNANNNFYALVSDELTVCPLGMLIINKNKKQHNMYIGQKVFATTKEDLCEYYRIQAKKKIEKLEKNVKNLKRLLENKNTSTLFCENQISYFTACIAKTQQQYKEVVEKIKKL